MTQVGHPDPRQASACLRHAPPEAPSSCPTADREWPPARTTNLSARWNGNPPVRRHGAWREIRDQPHIARHRNRLLGAAPGRHAHQAHRVSRGQLDDEALVGRIHGHLIAFMHLRRLASLARYGPDDAGFDVVEGLPVWRPRKGGHVGGVRAGEPAQNPTIDKRRDGEFSGSIRSR